MHIYIYIHMHIRMYIDIQIHVCSLLLRESSRGHLEALWPETQKFGSRSMLVSRWLTLKLLVWSTRISWEAHSRFLNSLTILVRPYWVLGKLLGVLHDCLGP